MKIKHFLTATAWLFLSVPSLMAESTNSAVTGAPLTQTTQGKKSFTLDDLMWAGKNYWNLQPKNIYASFWGDCLVETEVELSLIHI